MSGKYAALFLLPSWSRLRKNKLHELHGDQVFKRFSAKFVNFSAKFGSLNVQIRSNFKNIIFIACKWSKTFRYYVNSMKTSCSTCQKEEKECTWVKYLIYALLSRLPIYRNVRLFSAKSVFPKFKSLQKMFFFQVCCPALLTKIKLCCSNLIIFWNCQDISYFTRLHYTTLVYLIVHWTITSTGKDKELSYRDNVLNCISVQ